MVHIKVMDKTARVEIGPGPEKDAQFDRYMALDPAMRGAGAIKRIVEVVFYVDLRDVERWEAKFVSLGHEVRTTYPDPAVEDEPKQRSSRQPRRMFMVDGEPAYKRDARVLGF